MAEGFRLPTEAEQEYLLRAGGVAQGEYAFGDDIDELEKYAWYAKNAGEETHPVGDLDPMLIEGRDFYELHGNVWEWGWDWYGERLPGGTQPLRSLFGFSKKKRESES